METGKIKLMVEKAVAETIIDIFEGKYDSDFEGGSGVIILNFPEPDDEKEEKPEDVPEEDPDDGYDLDDELQDAYDDGFDDGYDAGYADGYPRSLSSKGEVLICGKRAKILGRVCMDQMCVDVSGIEDVAAGDEVILFGKDLPVEELAELCGTINYEIVCGVSPRVPRIVRQGDEL